MLHAIFAHSHDLTREEKEKKMMGALHAKLELVISLAEETGKERKERRQFFSIKLMNIHAEKMKYLCGAFSP